MPVGSKRPQDRQAVRHRLRGDMLTMTVPPARNETRSSAFQADVWANGHLGGLVRKPAPGQLPNLVPMAFAEVPLPHAPAGKVPHLRTRLPDERWACCWDARRRVIYVLAVPRTGQSGDLRFRIEWQDL
jgi:hypothetical protein